MQIKAINYNDLFGYILSAFDKDDELFKFYDQSQSVSSYGDMATNTYKKIGEYEKHFVSCRYFGVEIDGKKSGFYACLMGEPNLLISFSIAKEYRKSKVLSPFFSHIRNSLHNEFLCYLLHNNSRAIKWLIKCGMELSPMMFENNICVLNYMKCQ